MPSSLQIIPEPYLPSFMNTWPRANTSFTEGRAAALLKGFEHHRLIPPCDVDALVAAIKEYDGGACKRKLCLANRERVGSRHIREKSAEQLVQTISRTSPGG